MEKGIIPKDRSVVVAADVPDTKSLANLAKNMVGISGIGALKVGLVQGLQGLSVAVDTVKNSLGANFPVIFDLQKAGNDIPDMGKQFAAVLKKSGVDAAIIFPFTGTATQEAWTKSCFDEGIEVLTGGIMTHPKFLVSEGGYIDDEVPEKIYRLACKLGVKNFVVPGNKLDWVKKIRGILVEELGEDNFVLYAPGFITQKGDISECGLVAGKKWHAIVGSAIYGSPNQREAAMLAVSKIINKEM